MIRHTCPTCAAEIAAEGADEYRAALGAHEQMHVALSKAADLFEGTAHTMPIRVTTPAKYDSIKSTDGGYPTGPLYAADPMGGPPAQTDWLLTYAPHMGTLWLFCECGERITAPTYYGLMQEEAHHTHMCTANGQPKWDVCACVDGIQCFKHWQENKP